MTPPFDVAIVGGGIVGLATGLALSSRSPRCSLVILEKEEGLARHQSGRNSGVLHSGIYYRPGSLKAANCREGKRAMEQFCDEQGIPYEICGKVIVAVEEGERALLHGLFERGVANGVRCEIVSRERLAELEPSAAGIGGIHVPETGIVDYRRVCERLGALLEERGHRIVLRARVTGIRRAGATTVLASTAGDFEARLVVNCAGLHCDRVARMSGRSPDARIVPFRGEYFEIASARRHLCRNLIYPVPDPRFPFLGVHFTRRIDGSVECGPNAVLAFAREGYRMTDVNLADLAETLTYPGFLRMAARHWRTGLGEMWRSISKRAFTRALQRLVPDVRDEDLLPAPAGVRAQAVTPEGDLVDDFLIQDADGAIHVNNAPSPAATASLQIGRLVAERIESRLEAPYRGR
jgi:(S)-2-hydroxyglutarate dehydrogenase